MLKFWNSPRVFLIFLVTSRWEYEDREGNCFHQKGAICASRQISLLEKPNKEGFVCITPIPVSQTKKFCQASGYLTVFSKHNSNVFRLQISPDHIQIAVEVRQKPAAFTCLQLLHVLMELCSSRTLNGMKSICGTVICYTCYL